MPKISTIEQVVTWSTKKSRDLGSKITQYGDKLLK